MDEAVEGQGPNPVARVILVRTIQVGGTALLTLAALRALLPPERVRPLVPWGGALVTVGLSAYFVVTFTARLPVGAPIQTHLPAGDVIAFTFDDGPHPQTTPRLLDILRAHNAQATFFVVGEAVARFPDLVRRIRREGHVLGIHALRHRTMVLQNARSIEHDLRETLQEIEAAAPGTPVRLFRPPYGFKTVTLGRVATRLGLKLVAWSVDPRDYDPTTSGRLVARACARLRPGAIVLLHERPHAVHTLDALPHLLGFCARRGWRCVALA